jgi:hypothetical protein
MMNMVLSHQCCVVPMTRGSLCRVATLGSCTKKTNLCFSTPLLHGRKITSINRSPSLLLASALEAKPHPLIMIAPDHEEEDSLCRFYDYVNDKVINTTIKIPREANFAQCVGSSHGWLAYVSCFDCSIFLWSPFMTSPLISLPPIHTLPFIKVIPREEIDKEEIEDDIKSSFEFEYDGFPEFGFKVEAEYPDPSQMYYTRTPRNLSLDIINIIVLSSVPTSDDCIVVALSNLLRYQGIFFCKPGDKSWTYVEQPHKKHYVIADATHFKDQLFYTVSSCGNTLFAYDLANLSSPKSYILKPVLDERMRSYFLEPSFELKPSLEEYNAIYHLVESLGDLLLICRLIRRDVFHQWYDNDDEEDIDVFSDDDEFPIEKFEVYRLDFFRNTWEHAKCIGDQVLFLDNDQTLSLSAIDFPSLKANCIYFTGDSYRYHSYGHREQGGYVFGQFRSCFGVGWDPLWVMRHFHQCPLYCLLF